MRQKQHPLIEHVALTDIMQALSDPARLRIVAMLAKAGCPLKCGELVGERPKSSMSHHFKILRSAGLVRTEIAGTEHLNSLRSAEIEVRFPGLLHSVLKAVEAEEHARTCLAGGTGV